MNQNPHSRMSNNGSTDSCNPASSQVAFYIIDDPHAMSERVQSLADAVYREFERLIKAYDESVVKDLMPLVVAILENLETSWREKQQADVDSELLREDNKQLLVQYEKERQLRRIADQKYLVLEDSMEEEKKQLQGRLESFESIVRMFQIKLKNSQDQVARLEDKEQEMKKEFSKLHERYTDLLKAHMDFKERVKTLVSNNTTPLEGVDQSNFSADFTLPRNFKFSSLAWTPTKCVESMSVESSSESMSPVKLPKKPKICTDDKNENIDSEIKSASKLDTRDGRDIDLDDSIGSNEKVTHEQRSPSTDDSEQIPGQKRLITIDENLRKSLIGEMDKLHLTFCDEDGNYESQIRPTMFEELMENDERSEFAMGEALNIEERQDDYVGQSNGDDDDNYSGNENYNFYGVSKEIENLIMENNELLETKHALNIVKDDLIAKVDELTGEKEILKDELNSTVQAKERLKTRVNELEEEFKRMREELEKEKNKDSSSSHGDGEEDNVAPGQRKKFTRLEMARVLMERNQYKEKLMELQEAVRWAEMVRATRDHPEFGGGEKKQSSVWNFFSNLFGSNKLNSSYIDCSTTEHSVYYTTSPSTPPNSSNSSRTAGLNSILDRKKRVAEKDDRDMSFGSVDSPALIATPISSSRLLPLIAKEEGRIHACGWSLPPKFPLQRTLVSLVGQSEPGTQSNTLKSSIPLPLFCKPLLEEDPNIKILCAAAISWTGGKTPDGGSLVGASVFYSTQLSTNVVTSSPPKTVATTTTTTAATTATTAATTATTQETGGQAEDEIEKLNEEILNHEKDMKENTDFPIGCGGSDLNPSHVWVCVDDRTGSHVIVVDAANGGEVLEKFHVCLPTIHCITGVSGATEDDYNNSDNKLLPHSIPSSSSSSPQVKSSSAPEVTSSSSPPPSSASMNHVTYETVDTDEDLRGLVKDGQETGSAGQQPMSCSRSINDLANEEVERSLNLLPTVWIGNISGSLYIYSAVPSSRKRLHIIKLKDSVLAICHTKGRVFVALANGTVACFLRNSDGHWDVNGYYCIQLSEPTLAVRNAIMVAKKFLWCSVANNIYVLDSVTFTIEEKFTAHPRKENHVRQMVWMGEGVWVGLRNDSILRLYHAYTHQYLQDVDIEPCVSKFLGSSKLGFSLVQISCLVASLDRLWVGTGNGVVLSIPISESYEPGVLTSVNVGMMESTMNPSSGGTATPSSLAIHPKTPGGMVRVYGGVKNDEVYTGSFIPYCSIAQVQLSFHGHKEAVKFLIAISGNEKKIPVTRMGNKHAEIYRKYSLPLPSSTTLSLSQSPSSSSPIGSLGSETSNPAKCIWVMCGGEGCSDFRLGEEVSSDVDGARSESDETTSQTGSVGLKELNVQKLLPKSDKSHVIMWQIFVP